MKSQVLSVLKAQRSGYISGEDMSRTLGVSRTSVWKHIGALRDEGYDIEGRPRSGYRLVAVPDRFYPDEVTGILNTRFLGKRVFYYESVESTNRVAVELALKGVPEGSLAIAEEQTGGLGRLGRSWFSPRTKGIWCSLVLRPDITPGQAPPVTLLAAAAVAAGIRKATGINAGIKWPNDILYDGRKICGVLTEVGAEMDRVNYLVVGTGINVNIEKDEFPPELRKTALSLSQVTGARLERRPVLKGYLEAFERLYETWTDGGLKEVLHEWKKNNVTLGRQITCRSGKNTCYGIAEDLDDSGALIVRLSDGTSRRVVAGEVTLE